MAIHGRRYKRILTSGVFAYEMAQVLAGRFSLGTVDHESLKPEPTSSVKETSHERIADSVWSFDTDRQRTVMMIVEAQSSRERALSLRLLRYVVDRLLELNEAQARRGQTQLLPPVVVAVLYTGLDRWRPPSMRDLFSPVARMLMQFEFPLLYYDVLHMDQEEVPASRLIRMVFDVERCEDFGATAPVLDEIQVLSDRDAYALLVRFLSDKMRQWDKLRDEQGRHLLDASLLDDSRPLSEVVKEMETIQERFFRQLAERRAEGRAEGEVTGMLLSFRRTLAASGLDRRLARDVDSHVDRVVEAVRRGARFDLDDIPDGARLLVAIQEGGGPTNVPADRIWSLLPHIPEEDFPK